MTTVTTTGVEKMTVRELIEQLECHNLDMEVMAAYNYGDHSGTQALTSFCDAVALQPAKTAYSESGLCVSSDGDQSEIVALIS